MPRLRNPDRFVNASEATLLEVAKEVVEKEVSRSRIFQNAVAAESQLPYFHLSELILGRVVGRGGFGVVRELNEIRLLSENGSKDSARMWSGLGSARRLRRAASSQSASNEHDELDTSSSRREFLARRVWSDKGGKYVVKQVEPSLLHTDRVTFLKGTIDIVLEAHFLTSLQYPHILQLKGLPRFSPFREIGYFLVLEYLQESLPERLNEWWHSMRRTRGVTGFITGNKKKATNLLLDRLLVAYDVADVMDFLHGKHIIYRDLKPDSKCKYPAATSTQRKCGTDHSPFAHLRFSPPQRHRIR
jgi:serine/threonine protein kinase